MSRMNSNSVLRDALSNQTSSIFMDGLFICGYFAVLMVGAPLLAFHVVLLGLLHVLVSRLWIEEVETYKRRKSVGNRHLASSRARHSTEFQVLRVRAALRRCVKNGIFVLKTLSVPRL